MTPEESAQIIYQHLGNALSHHADKRKIAEEGLRAAEDQQDFFASLAAIATASEEEAESNIRWLAAVCGKNAVSRSWRRQARKNAVTEDERDYVRTTLLSALGEPTSTIATQLSVWISSIARVDFPSHWPDVLSQIIERMKDPQPRVMLHALTTLDMALKQLSSRRLISHRRALYRQGPNTFALLYDLFLSRLQILKQLHVSNDASAEALQVMVRCLKSFRRIISYATETPSDIPQIPQLFQTIVENPTLFLNGAAGGSELQRRLSLLTAKLVSAAQARHPIPFQPYLPTFMQCAYDTIRAFDSEVSDDRVCYHNAYFLRNVFRCVEYGMKDSTISNLQEQQPKNNYVPPTEISGKSCRIIVLQFFNDSNTCNLVEAIIGKVFVLNKRELDTWSNDPEMLVRDEEAAEWGTESLRHECEELFKMLLIRHKRTVVPLVLRLAESVRVDKPLLLDACYRAVGRAVYDVQGVFDIDAWLNHNLLSILTATCSSDLGERIVQARTVWLISQFAEQLNRESRIAVYPQFVRLMGSTEYDRVIALTAAKGLRFLVEDLGFVDTDFSQYLQTCLVSCFELIAASESYEMKRELLTTVVSIVSICRARIVGSVVDVIASFLPRLWEDNPSDTSLSFPASRNENQPSKAVGENSSSGGAENLLRTQVIGMLKSVVAKVGTPALQSEAFARVLYPVLEFSIDVSEGRGGIHLMEDGYDLWCTVVAASVEYSDKVRNLFPQTAEVLKADYSMMPRVFSLIQSYALLGGREFIQQYGESLLQTIGSAFESVRDRGSFAAVEVMDILLRLFPKETVCAISPLLRKMTQMALSKNESHALTTTYLTLIGRSLIASVEDVENRVFLRDEQMCLDVLDALIDQLDSIRRAPQRKMVTLAVCGLMRRYNGNAAVRERLPAVINMMVQILREEAKTRNRPSRPFSEGDDLQSMFKKAGGNDSTGADDPRDATLPEQERRKNLSSSDIENTASMRQACFDVLGGFAPNGASLQAALSPSVDPTLLTELEKLLSE